MIVKRRDQCDIEIVAFVKGYWTNGIASSYNFTHISVAFATREIGGDNNRYSHVSEYDLPWGTLSTNHWLVNLSLQSQGESTTEGFYAWHARYRDGTSIELKDAERIYKTLGRIQRLNEKERPETFGAYVQMVVRAMKVNKVVIDEKIDGTYQPQWSENTKEFGARFVADYIDNVLSKRVFDEAAKYAPKKVEVVEQV